MRERWYGDSGWCSPKRYVVRAVHKECPLLDIGDFEVAVVASNPGAPRRIPARLLRNRALCNPGDHDRQTVGLCILDADQDRWLKGPRLASEPLLEHVDVRKSNWREPLVLVEAEDDDPAAREISRAG